MQPPWKRSSPFMRLEQLIVALGDSIMSALDDLKKADADVDAAIQAGITEIIKLVQELAAALATGNVSPADIAPIVTNLETQAQALNTAVTNAETPPAPPV